MIEKKYHVASVVLMVVEIDLYNLAQHCEYQKAC